MDIEQEAFTTSDPFIDFNELLFFEVGIEQETSTISGLTSAIKTLLPALEQSAPRRAI